MAYDEDLANRIRELIAGEPGVVEKKMFGGLAFLIGGHMSVSASGRGGLLLHVPPEETESLLAKPHAGPFEMRGKTDGRLAPGRVRGRQDQAPAGALGPARRRLRPVAAAQGEVAPSGTPVVDFAPSRSCRG